MNIRLLSVSALTCLALNSFNGIAKASDTGLPVEQGFDLAKLSFSFEQTLPDLDPAFIDTRPTNVNDGIAVGDLSKSGANKKLILELANQIKDGDHGSYDSLLIAHKNQLVFESYYRKGRQNLPHFQASVTKSHTSLAVGRAIQMGYLSIADLDKPVHKLLGIKATEDLSDGVEFVTLNKVMSMRSGIRVVDDRRRIIMTGNSKKDGKKGANISDQFLRHSESITPDTQTFLYQDSDPTITMQVLDKVVPGGAQDFIKNEFLSKMGIQVYGWRNSVNGVPYADSGSAITSRDMLKLGMLVANKGIWKGEQIISAEFLEKATSALAKPSEDWIPDTYNYGYFWYQTDIKVGENSYDVKFAWGAGGNRIIVVAELDLVAVISGHDREDKIMPQVAQKILPAFMH